MIIKLIDFGMSKNFNPKSHEKNNMKTLAGTVNYIICRHIIYLLKF